MAELVAKMLLARSAEWALDVELTCPKGITCIMGPSGSGKSTILAVLAGLAVPDAGRVTVDGDVWLDREKRINVPTHERRLSYVFQGLALFPHMTALRNVEYGMQDVPRAERGSRAMALLQKVGVAHLATRKPRTFSGGEAQRVAVARALARSPKLVLLDEPFSALDRDLRAQLIALVRGVVADLNVPIVHVTHSVGEARQLADQIIRIEKGKIVAQGKPDEVLAGVTTLEE